MLYERFESVAEWQNPLHITKCLFQKLKRWFRIRSKWVCRNSRKSIWKLPWLTLSCSGWCSYTESSPAHTSVLYLGIPCSRHQKLRQVCSMAAVLEPKTESTLHYDLLHLVFPNPILFLRWVQESIERMRHGIVRQYPNSATARIFEANAHGCIWSFLSIKNIWEEGQWEPATIGRN